MSSVSVLSPSSPATLAALDTALRHAMEEVSGIGFGAGQEQLTFLELGLDSLLLTQVASVLQRRYKVPLSFRQLIEEIPTLEALTRYLGERAAPDTLPAAPVEAVPATVAAKLPAANTPAPASALDLPKAAPAPTGVSGTLASPGSGDPAEWLIAQQLEIMMRQLELMRAGGAAAPLAAAVPAAEAVAAAPPMAAPGSKPEPGTAPAAPERPIGPQVRIDLTTTCAGLSEGQRAELAAFIERYCARTQGSKRFTAQNRPLLADPRVVSGFKPLFKEMVYPIVVERSKGAQLWDVDGNEYVDITCGFGANFFGHTPDWVVEAVVEQLHKGMEIGPQTPLAAEVAQLITELTGFERVAFCNTGSEAVLGAMRICRTVTGRPLIVMFDHDYHGIFDEVIVRGSKSLRSRPAAAGIPPESVQNTLILEYGAPASLEIIKSRIDDIAAVLVEPVQGRYPELQPREFLHSLRELTRDTDTPLVFDEVITGFRIALGGAQEHFGVRADLATYGKIVGAGMPMGILAGSPKYMDALDGGAWQFGDESAPSVGVTYFAGTFVRHPPALAASRAALRRLKADGGQMQRRLNERTDAYAAELNAFFDQVGVKVHLYNFGSLCKIWISDDEPNGGLLYYQLRYRGVHAWEGRPAYLTLGHTEEDIQHVIGAFKASIRELVMSGLMRGDRRALESYPPVPGARLGKDPEGNPAWYVGDPERPGRYLKVEA